MASTPDMAPDAQTRRASARAKVNEVELQKQIDQLREDIKAIGTTLSRLGSDKVSEAEGRARREYRNLVRSGQHVMSEVGDEFGNVEKQIKDTIRERPLTAVLGALGIGFIIALLTR